MPTDVSPLNLKPLTQERINRFWSLVNRPSKESCWIWKGYVTFGGRPQIAFSRTRYYAHRLVYYFKYRKDPYPYLVLHKCDNPLCVNPDHLFLGTNADNIQDAVNKGRFPSKLSVQQVLEIKQLANTLTSRQIADKFGIDRTYTINCILRGTRRKIKLS